MERKGWLRHKGIYLCVCGSLGFLPIACVNCKKPIRVEDYCLELGYYRHKSCWEELGRVLKVEGIISFDKDAEKYVVAK